MKKMFAQIPDAPESLKLTDIYSESAQFPGAVLENGRLRVHYQKFKNRHDTIVSGLLGETGLEETETISGSGEALYPRSISFHGVTWTAWGEAKDDRWMICARFFKDGKWSDTIRVDETEAVFYPSFYIYQDTLNLLWTRQYRNAADAMHCVLTEEGAGEAEVVSVCKEVYRPNACTGGDGRLYMVYDSYYDGAYHALARVLTDEGWSDEVQLDKTTEWVCQSRVIASPKGATVCWYTFDYDAVFSVCSADLSCCCGKLDAQEPVTIAHNVGWYMDLDAATNGKGLQVVCYTWGKDFIQVRYRRDGGQWSQPAQVSHLDVHCAVHPSLMVTESEEIILAWQFAHRNGHYIRNAQTVLCSFTPESIDQRADPSRESAENLFCVPIAAEKHLDRRTDEEKAAWLKKNGYDCKLLFGDIHGQSGISDGMGTIDQYYRRSRAKADLEFSCLTDHDCYPDWISQSEWEMMRTNARLMDTDNELTCILSFEWTPNEYQYDFGHKNCYFRDDNGDIFRSGDQSGITPTDLYASLKKYKALCIPHHPAADWGMVSAATDWSFHDDQVERLAEIYSRHAPYEDDESVSKYTKNIKKMPRHSVQEALSRGYRMGFSAGSDSHQMDHGVEGGIIAAFTPTHDRGGVWDAMYDRRTYGTTGARILVSLKANGCMMGSELTLLPGDPVHFDISVLGTNTVKVELLRNNQVIRTWEPGNDTCDDQLEDAGTGEKTDWYYLRVTQPDEHMAWSSPIWVDRAWNENK